MTTKMAENVFLRLPKFYLRLHRERSLTVSIHDKAKLLPMPFIEALGSAELLVATRCKRKGLEKSWKINHGQIQIQIDDVEVVCKHAECRFE